MCLPFVCSCAFAFDLHPADLIVPNPIVEPQAVPEPPPKKRSYAFLTPKEKEVANKKKHPHRQSAKEFLESKGQCASWIKWTESEKDLFTLLLPRFYRASGSDFASFASL